MRRWKYILTIVPFVCALSWWAFTESGRSRANEQHVIRDYLERSRSVRSDEPGGGLAPAWAICLEKLQASDGDLPERIICNTRAGQGVTSALVALQLDGKFIPVVESQIADVAIEGRLVVDVVGGPGDDPFYSNAAVTAEMVEKFRGNEQISVVGGIMEERPHYQLMQRGFTIASVAYWGTSVRTLAEADEIGSAIGEVGSVINYYRDRMGREPPMVTGSLGNHLVLGALGKERLETMQVLSLVPAMDGLQHHLVRVTADEAWTSPDVLKGDWVWRNIYRREGDRMAFDHRRMIDQREFIPRYIGDADYPWRELELKDPCSTIVLGDKDPRTSDYLADRESLPSNVQVWMANHSLLQEVPDQARALFAEFADCLLEGQTPTG